MAKAPAFQLYAADFYMDTASWTIEEVGIYTRLLFYQWVNGYLPNDEKRLSRIAGCSTKSFQKWWCQIELKFSKRDEHNLINERLEETRKKQLNHSEKQANRASARWNKTDATAYATVEPRQCSSSSSSFKDINNINIGEKPKKQNFKPPSLDDIKNYCAERNNSIDPESFLNHYTSNGWMVGKNKMKDWKAAIRTWEKSDYGRGKDFRTGTAPPYSKKGLDRSGGNNDGLGIPPEWKGDDLPEPVDAEIVNSFIADFKKKLGSDTS